MTSQIWAFLGISILVIVTPGPDTAMTIRNTLLGGQKGGVATALGVATGQLVWALAASLGIVALLVASEPLFAAVKYAGAAYLIYLGVQSLIAAWHARTAVPSADTRSTRHLAPSAAYRQGVISDLGNPKMAVFFASVLPQFAQPGGGMLSTLVLLGLVFCLMTLVWLAFYAVALATAGEMLRRPRIRRALEGLTGIVLIALGLRLATEQR